MTNTTYRLFTAAMTLGAITSTHVLGRESSQPVPIELFESATARVALPAQDIADRDISDTEVIALGRSLLAGDSSDMIDL